MDHSADRLTLIRAPGLSPPAEGSSITREMVEEHSTLGQSDAGPADSQLVAAVLAGDDEAFALLFERYRRMVARVACRFFFRREDAEEMVQESFAEAYFALKGFRGGREKSFAAWLSRITLYTCYKELRRRSRRSESLMSELSEEQVNWLTERLRDDRAENAVERQSMARDLAAKLLDRLKPEDRLVLTLLEVEERSVTETAEITGWSVAKVKVRAHRARAAMRQALKRFW